MRRHTAILVLITCVMLLTACGPSDKAIQAAIEKTQMAEVKLPTISLPTITPTPEPELKVLDGDIEDFVPSTSDLDLVGLSMFHADEGEAIEYPSQEMEFGRVTTFYSRLYPDIRTEHPTMYAIEYSVTVYKTVTGAREAWESTFKDNIDENCEIGDACVSSDYTIASSVISNIIFRYKNVHVYAATEDEGDNIDMPEKLKITEALAQMFFDKLVTVQLVKPSEASFSNYVVFEPTQDETKTEDDTKTPKTAGYYQVNDEIAPGHWRTDSTSHSCYYAITNRQGEILENFFGRADGRDVFISSRAFEVEFGDDCGTWRFMGN